MHITSPNNPRIKNVVRLSANRRHREQAKQTVVEGSREVRRCLDAGVVPAEAYLCPELIAADDQDIADRLSQLATRNSQFTTVPPEVFAKIAVRGDSGGLLLVIPYTQTRLDDLPLSGQSLSGGGGRRGETGQCGRDPAHGRRGRGGRADSLRRGHGPAQPKCDPGQPGHPFYRARGRSTHRGSHRLAERAGHRRRGGHTRRNGRLHQPQT